MASDRTGTMCSLYHMAVEDWAKDPAIQEMEKGGYGFHKIFINLERYILGLDIAAIKKHAGLPRK